MGVLNHFRNFFFLNKAYYSKGFSEHGPLKGLNFLFTEDDEVTKDEFPFDIVMLFFE